jgi:hypothetical protein
LLVGDIAYTKDTLIPFYALSPKTKKLVAEVQGKLCGVGMKGALLFANGNQPLHLAKYLALVAHCRLDDESSDQRME